MSELLEINVIYSNYSFEIYGYHLKYYEIRLNWISLIFFILVLLLIMIHDIHLLFNGVEERYYIMSILLDQTIIIREFKINYLP